MQYAGEGCSCRPALFSNHQEWPQQAQGATSKDVPLRKLILRAFAAADEFKSARSLASSSVRLKAQAKLIDEEGGSKPAGKPAAPCGFRKRNAEPVSHAEKFGARCEVRPSKNAELVPAAVKC